MVDVGIAWAVVSSSVAAPTSIMALNRPFLFVSTNLFILAICKDRSDPPSPPALPSTAAREAGTSETAEARALELLELPLIPSILHLRPAC